MWFVTPCLGVTDCTKSQSLNTSTIFTHLGLQGASALYSEARTLKKAPVIGGRTRSRQEARALIHLTRVSLIGRKRSEGRSVYMWVTSKLSSRGWEQKQGLPCCTTLSEPVNIYETLWQTQVPCSSFNKFRRAHWTLSFKPHKLKKSQVKDVFIRGDVSLPFSRLSSLKGLLRSHRLIKMHERWSQYLYFTACMCANKKADIFSRVGQTELPVICALAWWRGAQSVRRVFIEGSFMSVNPFRRRLRLHPLSLDRIIQ